MKSRFFSIALILVWLGACSSEEPATEPVADEPVVDAPDTDTPAENVAETPADDDDAIPEAVEESIGDDDDSDEEKPIVLAQANTSDAPQDWQFSEGTHFHRLVPTQPTIGGADKIEVAEFFWYGCGHCLEFEPYINRWAESVPANVRFVRVPATWNPLVKLHAQLYYAEQALVANGKIANPEQFRANVFNEYHRRGNRMTSVAAISEVFERNGVSADDFNNAWNSFDVMRQLNTAGDLARRYAITGVPAMVVNGKYRSGKAETGTYPRLLEVVDELVARESQR